MKRLLLLMLLLSPALAQDLLSLAPQGAIAGMSIADFRNSRYTKGIAADWKQSGMEAFFSRELRKEAQGQADLVGIASGGAAAAVYSDGFFAITRPSTAAMQALRKQTKGLKAQNGWMVATDKTSMTGFSRDLAFVATPRHGRLFLQNRRGLQAPTKGDVVLWGSPPQDLLGSLGLPPRTEGATRTLRRFTYALKLNSGGYTDETRLEVNPAADPAFASFFLPKERPYDVADLPSGYAVGTGVLDIGRFAAYISSLAREFGTRVRVDLSAFGPRYAVVTVKGPPPAPDGRSEAILGHSLIYWEVKNADNAEESLLDLLKQLADFSTPKGQGGFKPLPAVGDFKAVELGLSGTFYYKLEASRIVIATSKSALAAVNNKPWKEDPNYARYKSRIPANSIGYSFGDQGQAWADQVGNISPSLPQTIGSQLDKNAQRELSKALTDFMTRLGKRFSTVTSYAITEGNTLVGRGQYDVKW
jgi:hypothetical protein